MLDLRRCLESDVPMEPILLYITRFGLPLLGLVITGVCILWLLRLRKSAPPEALLINAVNHDRLPLARFENAIGRSKHCDIVLNYPSVSRLHAVIMHRNDGWVILDTGSRTGTKLDGLPLEQRKVLEHGQAVTFGNAEFLFFDAEEERRGLMY